MNLKKSYKIANFQCLFKVLCAQVESFNSPDIVDKMPDSIKANIHKKPPNDNQINFTLQCVSKENIELQSLHTHTRHTHSNVCVSEGVKEASSSVAG